jgi:UDP-N-acetylglucosamine 1-carboxyvinyltransferase
MNIEKFIVKGGRTLNGTISVSGAKNVVLKAFVAACLTEEEVVIHNIPLISDLLIMADIIRDLGGIVTIEDHTARIKIEKFTKSEITLDQASHIRTSSMFLAPLLVRNKHAVIPNPGGCRLGARPIDRTIDGMRQLGATISYVSDDGFFHATAEALHGITYTFEKSTHTGTETMIIAAVLAKGKTVLKNAAEEPEIDELISLLNSMGAHVKRVEPRIIEIDGVESLHGAEVTIMPDRNEVVTFAIAALVTKGDVFVKSATSDGLKAFLDKYAEAGGGYEVLEDGIRFYYSGELKATDVTTAPYPGFMTDWQAPWAVLMTQAKGTSTIHEVVFENKLQYVRDLQKMGADATLFNPEVADKQALYNFNLDDDRPEYFHAVRITGPKKLHDAIVTMHDIRAGAAVLLAALAATGDSVIHNVHLIERGYEQIEIRLNSLGAEIKRTSE